MSVVTVVPTVEESTGPQDPPRIRLDVTDVGTSPSITSATVLRRNPDGTVVPVRTNDGNPLPLTTSGADRVGLLYDYEAPFDSAVSYSTTESPTVVSAQVTIAESKVWIMHPGVPALSMPVTVAKFGERSRKVQRGVFTPMGRRSPVVVTTGQRGAAEYTLSLYTSTDTERENLGALLDDAGTVLLNVPAGKGWGVGAEYVAVGDVAESRTVRVAAEQSRVWDLPCTVVDMPVGGSQAERTLLDLLDYASLDAVNAAYPTLNALLAGP